MKLRYPLLFFVLVAAIGCSKDPAIIDGETINYPTSTSLVIPPHFEQYLLSPFEGKDNQLTIEGIALGKKLFYEKALSVDGSVSCGSCHDAAFGFTDNGLALSQGVNGAVGEFNSMPIVNLAWQEKLFWDGRSESLEDQAFLPVVSEVEMHNSWKNAASTLQDMEEYPPMFEEAFGTDIIDSVLVVKAIAQFERTLISANSKWDRVFKFNAGLSIEFEALTLLEAEGREIYTREDKGDCTHCHGDLSIDVLITKNTFNNNGLDFNPDSGLAKITNNPDDVGKFKSPTLRNLIFTAPYMHDGRFATLEEVIDHYSENVKRHPTLDPNLEKHLTPGEVDGGVELTQHEKDALIAFLKTLTDSTFINNPNFIE